MHGRSLGDHHDRVAGVRSWDATGLEDRYEVTLGWDPDRPGDLERVLGEQLGLALEEGRATIEVLVVR